MYSPIAGLRYAAMAAAVFVLAACSTPDSSSSGTAVPGSQEDLAQNVGDRVFFEFDQSNLRADAQATLGRQAEWLKKYPNNIVTLEGHCDERGTREYNLALGERRASAARDYLVSMGIDASRISTISYGKERPVALCSDESCWSQNRRAVTMVTGSAGS